MDLFYPRPPVAGQNFDLFVNNYVGTVTLEWHLDNSLAYTSGCDDPPCHEVFYVPADAHGKTLYIVGTDEVQRETLRLKIGETIISNNPATATG